MFQNRIEAVCSYLTKARVFADVGCDHGYCTAYMLENGLCERAYISDISSKSLQKAETLLAPYIAEGKCIPVVADGLQGLQEPCDLVLIAGMGGEVILRILSEGLPERFVLQPMHNADKVRKFLSGRVTFLKDETFRIGKQYYDILVLGRGEEKLTPLEIRFGKGNIANPSEDFIRLARNGAKKTRAYLEQSKEETARVALEEKLREWEELLHVIERR